jgi:hypothetical protein
MPTFDVDGGLNYQNYNPKILSGRQQREQYVSKPFYFGGSQVPNDLNMSQASSGSGMMSRKHILRKLFKLPNIRK